MRLCALRPWKCLATSPARRRVVKKKCRNIPVSRAKFLRACVQNLCACRVVFRLPRPGARWFAVWPGAAAACRRCFDSWLCSRPLSPRRAGVRGGRCGAAAAPALPPLPAPCFWVSGGAGALSLGRLLPRVSGSPGGVASACVCVAPLRRAARASPAGRLPRLLGLRPRAPWSGFRRLLRARCCCWWC